jgi:MFS family permease
LARWRRGTFRALRHRNYRLYFAGQLVSLTGSWVQTAALTWLAWDLTHQSRWPALVGAAQTLPTLALGVWGGSLADRWPRRPLICATQTLLLLLAGLLAALVLLGQITPAGLLAVAGVIGIVNAVDTPARLAFIIDMVGRDDLPNAVALNSLQFNVARCVGPALCGVLLAGLGAGPCFVLNALTFLAVLAALAAMRLPPRPALPTGSPPASLFAGFRHLGRHPLLLLLLLLAGALGLFGWPVLALLPALSARCLRAGHDGYAWMLSAVGAGALVGALLVASFGTRRGRLPLLMLGVVLASSALVGLALVRDLAPAAGCCALLGCGLILFFATGQGVMQLGAGDDNRGQVMGIWLMVLAGAQPLGQVCAGRLADAWGEPAVLALQACGIALAALAVGLLGLAGRLRRRFA